jgi:hypothetical protein
MNDFRVYLALTHLDLEALSRNNNKIGFTIGADVCASFAPTYANVIAWNPTTAEVRINDTRVQSDATRDLGGQISIFKTPIGRTSSLLHVMQRDSMHLVLREDSPWAYVGFDCHADAFYLHF